MIAKDLLSPLCPLFCEFLVSFLLFFPLLLYFFVSWGLISSVRSLIHVQLFATPWTAECHQLLELAKTHVHWVSDAIHPSHSLLYPSPPAFNLSQHQGLFQWVSSLHQVAKVLELQLQHQFFQWIFRTDFP